MVQAGLEAATRLLSCLQENLPSRAKDVAPIVQTVTPAENNMTKSTESQPTSRTPVSFIAVQQVLTCYSYVLLILDRVITAVTSDAWTAALI